MTAKEIREWQAKEEATATERVNRGSLPYSEAAIARIHMRLEFEKVAQMAEMNEHLVKLASMVRRIR